MAAKTLKPGPLAGQDLSLLKAGASVLLDPHWGPMVFDRFDDSERRAFLTGGDGQVRLLIPAKMTYIGERGPDGWIAAPEGGWSDNPVPGMRVEVQIGDATGTDTSDNWSWGPNGGCSITAFRPAEAQASTDQSAEASEKVEGADTLAEGLGVAAWRIGDDGVVYKSAKEADKHISGWLAQGEPCGEKQPLTPHAEASRLLAERDERVAELEGEIAALNKALIHVGNNAERDRIAAEADAAKLREVLQYGNDVARLADEMLRARGLNVMADQLVEFTNRAERALAQTKGRGA